MDDNFSTVEPRPKNFKGPIIFMPYRRVALVPFAICQKEKFNGYNIQTILNNNYLLEINTDANVPSDRKSQIQHLGIEVLTT